MSFILSPSQTLYYLGQTPTKLFDKIQGYISSGNSLVVYNHKKLSVYNISNINQLTQQQQQVPKVNEADFNKKVETFSIIDDSNVIVSDKYGDIFLVQIGKDKQFLNQNFSIPTLLHYVDINKQDRVFIVGDQYSKTKVFNFNNPHQIYSIWTPFEATLLQIITYKDILLYFVKISKKDSVDCKYQLYTLKINNLKNQQFPGVLVEQFKSNFSDDHYAKIVVNQNNVYIVSLETDKLIIQKIQLGEKLIKKQTITEHIGKQDWSYIDVAYSNSLYIYIGKQKLQNNQQQQKVFEGFKQNQNVKIVESTLNEYLISILI